MFTAGRSSLFLAVSLLFFPELAHAESVPAVAAAVTTPSNAPANDSARSSVPAAQRGFQTDVRGGYTHNFGKLTRDIGPDPYKGGPFVEFGAGGRIIPHVYLGGFMRLAGSSKFGAEAIYYVMPGARFSPWVGYAFGLDVTAIRDLRTDQQQTFTGPMFGRLTLGSDVRINHYVGVGVFADASLGRYSSESRTYGDNKVTRDIRGKTLHGDASIGLRFILFP